MIAKSIREGSIHIKPNFLSSKEFEVLSGRKHLYTYREGYQPAGTYYGNRYQAYPVWETDDFAKIDTDYFDLFKNKHQEFLEDEISFFMCRIRKTFTEEIKRSKVTGKYGHIHQDYNNDDDDPIPTDFASVFYFVQSFDGGTAFFENRGDTEPDIEISAYKNRLITYNSARLHTNCTDFTFKERYVVVCFLRTTVMDFELRKKKLTTEIHEERFVEDRV